MTTMITLPKARRALVSPDEAKRMLATIGLTLDDFRIDGQHTRYAKIMIDGGWRLNCDAIIFDTTGKLIAGRQRLAACILSGVHFPTIIVEGVQAGVENTIDRHKRRTNGDVMHISGVENSRRIAAVCNAIYCMIHGLSINHKENRHEMVGMAVANPDIGDALAKVRSMTALDAGSRQAPLAAAVFLTSKIAPEKSAVFFDKLASFNDEKNRRTPWVGLGRALRGMKTNRFDSVRKRLYIHAYTVKAWNAFFDDVMVGKFEFRPDTELLPRLRGLDPESIDFGNSTSIVAVAPNNDYTFIAYNSRIRVEAVLITPEMAEDMLRKNGPSLPDAQRNRKISKQTVDLYIRDMSREDGWKLNGQAIKISITGRILDGQHRLTACVASGRSFWTMLATGIEDSVFATYDTSTKKNESHALQAMGVLNPKIAASSMRIVWRGVNFGFQPNEYSTPIDMDEFQSIHLKAMEPSISFAANKAFKPIIPASSLGALHYILTKEDSRAAEAFFSKLRTGENLSSGDPILVLRNALMSWSGKSVGDVKKRSLMSERMVLAWALKAWVAFRDGKKLTPGQLSKKTGFSAPYDGKIVIDPAACPPAANQNVDRNGDLFEGRDAAE